MKQLVAGVQKRLGYIQTNLGEEKFKEFWEGKFPVVILIAQQKRKDKIFATEGSSSQRNGSVNTEE